MGYVGDECPAGMIQLLPLTDIRLQAGVGVFQLRDGILADAQLLNEDFALAVFIRNLIFFFYFFFACRFLRIVL